VVKKRERQPSLREVRDVQLKEKIMRVWENRKKGRGLYGRGKCGCNCAATASRWRGARWSG
jgi:hypothetical protein